MTICLGVFISSCNTTQSIAINTLEPAPVSLSHKIKRIGVFSNELSEQQLGSSTGLEAWISHSDQQLAAAGKEAAVKGLIEVLTKDSRFDTIQILNVPSDFMVSTEMVNSQIPWEEMESICTDNQIDALFSLAYYETDTRVSLRKTKVNLKDLLRENIRVSGHEITLETLIENGWRIYDPYNRLVLDEIILNDHLVSRAEGEDPIDAFQAIEDRTDSIVLLSGRNGGTFGSRLQPFENIVYRDYYIKGSDNLVEAQEMTLNNDWKNAKRLWELDTANPDDKIKSRACYNLAVFNEYHGDLETALDWTIKANSFNPSKLTETYIEALEDRLNKNRIVEEQLLQLSPKLSKADRLPQLDSRH